MRLFLVTVSFALIGAPIVCAHSQEILSQPRNTPSSDSISADKDAAADAVSPAQSKPEWKPRRRRPRYKHFKKKKSKPNGPLVRLQAGRWTPQARTALEKLLSNQAEKFKTGSTDDEILDMRPAAVFVLDDVIMIHHAGEAAFYRLVTEAEFKFNDQFWPLLPPPYNHEIKMGYDEFKRGPRPVWSLDAFYLLYRKSFFQAYQSICVQQGIKTCHSWLTSLLRGFQEEEVARYMAQAIEEAMRRPARKEAITKDIQDASPVRVQTGMETTPEFRELISKLLKYGFDVWIFSSSNQWAAEAAAAAYGIEADHVRGVRPQMDKLKVLQAEIEEPIPDGAGRAELITSLIGHGPALTVGGSAMDKDMLLYGSGLKLIVDHGDAEFARYARDQGWLVQPAFLASGHLPKKAH